MCGDFRYGLFSLCLVLTVLHGCAYQGKEKPAQPDTAGLRQCAETAYQDDDLAKSERCYKQLSEAATYTADDWYRLGNIYARTQRPGPAINAYTEALTINPGIADAWYNLGIVRMELAVKSFLELQNHARADDPVYEKSDRLVKGILELIDAEPDQPP